MQYSALLEQALEGRNQIDTIRCRRCVAFVGGIEALDNAL
jgi:hypothetical protein